MNPTTNLLLVCIGYVLVMYLYGCLEERITKGSDK